jgi:hypothetical protein
MLWEKSVASFAASAASLIRQRWRTSSKSKGVVDQSCAMCVSATAKKVNFFVDNCILYPLHTVVVVYEPEGIIRSFLVNCIPYPHR